MSVMMVRDPLGRIRYVPNRQKDPNDMEDIDSSTDEDVLCPASQEESSLGVHYEFESVN